MYWIFQAASPVVLTLAKCGINVSPTQTAAWYTIVIILEGANFSVPLMGYAMELHLFCTKPAQMLNAKEM